MQPETRRRKGSRHDKTGCLTCRYRRKKCTENSFPVCGTCSRLNLKCICQVVKDVVPVAYAEQEDTSTDVAASEPPSPQPAPMVLATPGAIGHCADSPRKRHAMGYYISVLTNHLTVSQEFNSFLTAFLPMAMESAALSDVLLALATGHLSLIDESHKVAALETRSAAIRNLSAAIKTPSNELARHETNAAASLAFVIYETGVGDHGAWYTHLKGTQQIIMSTTANASGKLLTGPEAFKTSTEGQWVLLNFAYHDVIGSVTLQTRPLLDDDILDGITNVVDSCLGVATDLLRFIARVCCLDDDTTLQVPLTDEECRAKQQQFHYTYTRLERDLLDWHCLPEADPGLAALAYAYRNAALIILYRLNRSRLRSEFFASLDGHGSTPEDHDLIQAKVQAQVSNALQHISRIPVDSAPESALLFPVFIVGGEALKQAQIDTLRTRLRHMAKKRQFRNLSQAWEVLEDLWEWRNRPDGADADWKQLLTASGQHLLLT